MMTTMNSPRRNRRRYDSQINQDRWLVSYADFITLLFAFFTTMYAISTVDAKKLHEVVESMQKAFDANQPMHAAGTTNQHANVLKSDPSAKPVTMVSQDKAALEALKTQLSDKLKQQIAGGQVGLEVDPRGLVVSIREAGTFAVGSADLSDGAMAVLEEVANAIRDLDNQVRVEGHTDDVPIHTASFRSNWELSTARATNVVKFMVEDEHLSASRFSAAGYGEFRPRAPNESKASRAQNRRVDLVILNEATAREEAPQGPQATP